MCHSRAVLVCFLVVAMNVSAQDSPHAPKAPSIKEKQQALAALTQARGTLFPLRRKREVRQLLARVAPLLAAAGDAVGAQDVLTLLPSNERDAVQPLIIAAQVDSGQIAASLETAAAISSEDSKAAALLLIAGGQAKGGEFSGALRTAALIPAGRVESVQALVEIAQQQKLAERSDEASQILRRAATAAAGLANSNSGDPDCGLSMLAEIANAQEGLGESTEAVKTLQLAEGRVPNADSGCRFGATRYLQDNDAGKAEIFKTAIAGFRERLNSSNDSLGNEEQNEEDSYTAEESTANSVVEPCLSNCSSSHPSKTSHRA